MAPGLRRRGEERAEQAPTPRGGAPAPASARTDTAAGPDLVSRERCPAARTGPGYRRAGQSAPRSPIPRELFTFVDTHTPPSGRPAPAFPPHPAARFSSGLLPSRSHSRAGRENDSLHRRLNGTRRSLGANSRPPRPVPRCPGGAGADPGTRRHRRPPPPRPCPGLGSSPAAGDAALSFPSRSVRSGEAATGPELRHLRPARERAAGAGPDPAGPKAGPEPGPYAEPWSRVGSLQAGPGSPRVPPLSPGTRRCRAP